MEKIVTIKRNGKVIIHDVILPVIGKTDVAIPSEQELKGVMEKILLSENLATPPDCLFLDSIFQTIHWN